MRTLAVNALRLVGNRTAMGHYIEYLAHYWSRMAIPFDRVVLFCPVEVPLESLDLGRETNITCRCFHGRWPLAIWEQIILSRAARGAAVLFCPSYTCPILFQGRLVVANHGIYESLPAEFSWQTRLRTMPLNRLSARCADRVIANSQTTKSDLIEYFHVGESKIDVIYPAAHPLFFAAHSSASIDQEVVKALGQKVPYILFVGKLSKRRNVPRLIEAFSLARNSGNWPHHLLIVGPNVNDIPIDRLAEINGVTAFVKHHPYVNQEQLAKLYAGADLYVLPTTYEGISWTMFEAMASGTAVLTVDHPTLHEAGADAAYAVPTPSVEDLAKGLATLLANPALRQHYGQEGQARARQRSWHEAAKATVEVLDRVALPSDQAAP